MRELESVLCPVISSAVSLWQSEKPQYRTGAWFPGADTSHILCEWYLLLCHVSTCTQTIDKTMQFIVHIIVQFQMIVLFGIVNNDKCLGIDKVMMNCQSCLMTSIGLGKLFTWRNFGIYFLLYIVLATSDFRELKHFSFSYISTTHKKVKHFWIVDDQYMIPNWVLALNCLWD